MYQDKKSIKNDINNIKSNMDIDKLKMNKYISQINTLEEIKNAIVYELNTESNRKLNSSKNLNYMMKKIKKMKKVWLKLKKI